MSSDSRRTRIAFSSTASCASSERSAKYACVIAPARLNCTVSRAYCAPKRFARAASLARAKRPQKSSSKLVEAASVWFGRISGNPGGTGGEATVLTRLRA